MLTGRGRFVADCVTDATLHAGFLRSDFASAKCLSLDVSAARNVTGLVAVFTAEDLAAGGIGPMVHADMPREDGGVAGSFPQPILCSAEIRHMGEPVAMAIAQSSDAISDAIEAIEVEMDETPPIEGVAFHRKFGNQEAALESLSSATHRHRVSMSAPRATAFSIEPRGAIATPQENGCLAYRCSTQNPFALREQICRQMGWETDRLRVFAEDVGGSFGLKSFMTREDAALVWAADKLGREIAWLPSRSEAMLSDSQGRGITGHVEVGLDADLKIISVTADIDIDAGAYPDRRAFGFMCNINGLTGMYHIPNVSAHVTGQLSPRLPLVPLRGNGRAIMRLELD